MGGRILSVMDAEYGLFLPGVFEKREVILVGAGYGNSNAVACPE